MGRSPSPEQIRKAVALRGQRHLDMLEDYQDLVERQKETDEMAAQRLGVHLRTIQRYKREISQRKRKS